MSYLKIARDKKNQNGSQASAVLGFSRQHLSRLEQGKTLATREQAMAIREYLGVPVLEVGHVSQVCGTATRDRPSSL
ncbi:MAG: helix-turn-helix transcriptional regulator [Candidatus Eremiobacteraeota bacterium]|nr:helix-turn-helix transcriptional regulator [Candidatus Eremiobacteraeota bacterium]MCW5870876.1 helix-turn-helix transcriptional regulator [Candidatus Eremiobacteraeota bacterium]